MLRQPKGAELASAASRACMCACPGDPASQLPLIANPSGWIHPALPITSNACKEYTLSAGLPYPLQLSLASSVADGRSLCLHYCCLYTGWFQTYGEAPDGGAMPLAENPVPWQLLQGGAEGHPGIHGRGESVGWPYSPAPSQSSLPGVVRVGSTKLKVRESLFIKAHNPCVK